ncbi:hypothetical protein DSO57_1032663 [Entomophthora muscae]|uniref:Uncharacterized protein n=1 Tax=Entomophthora muscae TaxID=34485 RepID=A0ACC2S283_9FUNG|nr:hypothetical protein DSO57_1032663 [Entomophthora muscae]
MAGISLAVAHVHAGQQGRGKWFTGWIWVAGVFQILHSSVIDVGKEHRWGWRVLEVRTLHGWGCEFATWGEALGANLAFAD